MVLTKNRVLLGYGLRLWHDGTSGTVLSGPVAYTRIRHLCYNLYVRCSGAENNPKEVWGTPAISEPCDWDVCVISLKKHNHLICEIM